MNDRKIDDEAPALRERLLLLDSCAVSDALDSLSLPPAVIGLSPLSVATRIAGPVSTVKLGPERPPGESPRHLGTAAIETASPGNIIAIEHGSGVACAGWGGVLSAGAQLNGIAGVIIDGPARDIDEAQELGFPVYGRSAVARTARGRVYEQDFDCPIGIGDVIVRPGDYALADSSGVVFIPRHRLKAVLARAERIAERERLMIEALRGGDRITEVLGCDYEEMLSKL